MVVVLAIGLILVLARVEQQLSSHHFEGHACERPDVCSGVVHRAYQHFRTSVLPGLNLRCEVMVSPARISKICNLNLESTL